MRFFAGWLFFLLALQGAATNEGAFVTKIQLEHTFQFDPYPDVHGETVNDILQIIAQGSGKLRAFTKYSFLMNVDVKTQRLDENSYSITVIPREKSVHGDVVYRDFSLEKVLIPDKVNFSLMVQSANGNYRLTEAVRAVDVLSENAIMFESAFTLDEEDDGFEVSLYNAFFYYDDRIHERFNAWATALESYYATGYKLSDVQNMISALTATDPVTVLLDEFSLCDAEVVMGKIHNAPFHNWVNIRENDPEKIFPLYEYMHHSLDSLRAAFNFAIAHIDSLYFEKAMMVSADTCLIVGSDYFLSAISYNPYHVPSHLALMQIEILRGDKAEAIRRLGDIYDIMYPSGLIRVETDALADSLLGLFNDAAWELIVEKKYLESLDMLKNVRDFCKQTEGKYPCPPFLNLLTRQNHLGMYDSYIIVSSRALRNDNLELAATYIGSAINYQTEHKKYITDHNKAMGVLSRIITRYRVLSEMSSMLDDQPEAEKYRLSGKQLLQAYPGLYQYLKKHASAEELNTAVINYAVLLSHHKSIALLDVLRASGVDASQTEYQQRVAGKYAAFYYRERNLDILPGEIFGNLNVHAPWYRAFRQGFLDNWER